MRQRIENQTFDEERSLYHLQHGDVISCTFAGPADGESALKECRDLSVADCYFDLRYPFWHCENVTVYDSVISGEYAAWYSKNLRLFRCKIVGTQPFCYAENLYLEDCVMENCDLSFENSSVNATVNSKIDSVKNPLHGYIKAKEYGEIILDEHKKDGADCKIEVF